MTRKTWKDMIDPLGYLSPSDIDWLLYLEAVSFAHQIASVQYEVVS